MTDKQTLAGYRIIQAEETLSEAEILQKGNASPRSVINRAYILHVLCRALPLSS